MAPLIDERDLQAWAYLCHPERSALSLSKGAESKDDSHGGALVDLSCGVKDNIDVAGMPTAFGVDFRTIVPDRDAWCVARIREAGASILGKTAATAFAYRDPAPTRNPWNAERTPGGSSSGSAAAVAAGHVEFALGTQTLGSVLRPASFCGVVGFKPTYGAIPVDGVCPLAPTLDTVGVLARDVEIATRVARVLLPGLREADERPPRLLVDLALNVDRYGLPARDAAAGALAGCAERGAVLTEADLAQFAVRALATADTIMAYEMHESLGSLLNEAHTPRELAAMLERGSALSRQTYERALSERDALRAELPALFASCDALAVLCAGPAPPRETTGDAAGQAPWTLCGAPSISLPVGFDADGLPLSLQLVAPPGADAELLSTAKWVDFSLLSR